MVVDDKGVMVRDGVGDKVVMVGDFDGAREGDFDGAREGASVGGISAFFLKFFNVSH